MAIRWAVANGVWSNIATWNGGTLPTSADDVFANNFTVTVDQDITASSLRSTSNTSPAIATGGFFNVTGSTGTRNIALSGTNNGGASVGGLFTHANTSGVLRIASTSGQTVNVNCPMGNPQTFSNSLAEITGNATVNWSGIFSQPQGFSPFWYIRVGAANGTLNLVGNLIAATSGPNIGLINIAAPNFTLNIVGNLTSTNDYGIVTSQACTVNITGNLTAGVVQGISPNVNGFVCNITGNVAAATSQAINSQSFIATITVNGNISASSTAVGILTNNASSIVTANGNLTNTNDYMVVFCPKMRISPTTQQTWTLQTGSGNRQMFTSNAFTGTTIPAASDVRFGVSYANGTLSGTCYVPPSSAVTFGVPVDNTVGNAIISVADLYTNVGALMQAYPQI